MAASRPVGGDRRKVASSHARERRHSARRSISAPLNRMKRRRVREQIEWIVARDRLKEVDDMLRALDEADWQ